MPKPRRIPLAMKTRILLFLITLVCAAAASLVFYINSGLTVTISGLTITNGSADNGSGIYNDHSNLTVSSSTVSDNSASYGGGIFNDGGFDGLSFASLTINNSTVSGNSASVIGGGILNFGPDGIVDLTINNSTVSGNLDTSGGDGGGIHNDVFDGHADLN